MKQTAKSVKSGEHGFTLVEMLIALSILALIASLSSAAIVFAANASARAGTSTEKKHIDAVVPRISSLIASARPVFGNLGGDQLGLAFVGTEDRLVFIGRAPAPTELPGLYVTEFFEDTNGPNGALVMRYWPFRAADSLLETPEQYTERELIKDVNVTEFSYGIYDTEDGWVWTEDWPGDPGGLPHLVSLKLVGIESKSVDAELVSKLHFGGVSQD